MISNSVRWVIHWLGQGLKLWLFATIASLCMVPLYWPLGLLESWTRRFEELGLFGKSIVVLGHLVCYSVGLAVFTAVLASQLKDQPLRPFVPREKPVSGSRRQSLQL